MRKIALLIFIAFITNSCSFEDYDTRTYYDTVGVGYVYYGDTKYPVSNATVVVWSEFASHGWATNQPIEEHFFTEENGFFKVKFLNRTHKDNVLGYTIYAYYEQEKMLVSQIITFSKDQINKQNIQIDTLYIH